MTTEIILNAITLNTLPTIEAVVEPAPLPEPAKAPAVDLSQSEYVAVTDADPCAGVATWWSMSGPVNAEAFTGAWEAAGLDLALLPSPTTPLTALNVAIKSLTNKRRLRRPLKGHGYALVSETASDTDVDHVQDLAAVVDTLGTLVITPWDHADAEGIRARYETALGQWSADYFGASMVGGALAHASGVSMRRMGGIYFIPQDATAFWASAKSVIEGNTDHTIYQMPVMRSGDAVKAVLDAVVSEATAASAKMADELASGDLGKRGLKSRAAKCDDMLGKLAAYEGLLGSALDSIKAKVTDLRGDAVAATLMLDS